MSTPRSAGVLPEAIALKDAAAILGDPSFTVRAGDIYRRVVNINLASPLYLYDQSQLQPDIDSLGSDMQQAYGVNPLDVDVPGGPPGAGAALNDAASGNVSNIASGAVSNVAGALGSGLKLVLVLLALLIAWLLFVKDRV